MNKPIVFNYGDYKKVVEENKKLKEDIANLQIRCRIAESEKPDIVRCKDCKYAHMTYGGECKYCDKWVEDGEALYLEGDFFCAYGERREP